MKQAMAIAACMEFSGSVSVGSRVAETIRTKIINPHLYDKQPAVLLLAMMCAIIGSSTFLTLATRLGWPVSTTHSIVGGLVGAGTASVGIRNVSWGWGGVSQVFAAWAIAPGIAGTIGATLFLITKYCVMRRRRSVMYAFLTIPVYTFITVGALTSETLPLTLLESFSPVHSASCVEGYSTEIRTLRRPDCHIRLGSCRRSGNLASHLRASLPLAQDHEGGLAVEMV